MQGCKCNTKARCIIFFLALFFALGVGAYTKHLLKQLIWNKRLTNVRCSDEFQANVLVLIFIGFTQSLHIND
jgi:hypothetical protein